MKKKKAITFVYMAENPYFIQLGDTLKPEYDVHYLGLKPFLTLKQIIMDIAFTKDFELPQSELEEIILYYNQLRKYSNTLSIRRKLRMHPYLLKKQVLCIIQILLNHLKDNEIDVLCVWNGNRLPLAVAVYVARKLNIKTLFFENGVLPNTTTVDGKGVNFRNSFINLAEDFFANIEIVQDKLEKIKRQSLEIREKRNSKSGIASHTTSCKDVNSVQLPENFLFIPFQVHDDTQVLLFSPKISTMEQLLEYVWVAVEEYNRQTMGDLRIVVKEHPSDAGRVNYAELRDKYKACNVLFANDHPTETLIKQSRAVVTLNSSVGIEALLYDKHVITLANAFYNIPGVVTSVQEPEFLSEYLPIINTSPNIELINKFLYYLRYTYLADGSWRNPDEKHFQSVRSKIEAQFL